MEQPLSRDRNLFLEELSKEGERLWEQADLEGWFGAARSSRLSTLFLAHRLQALRWDMEAMRDEPIRRMLESICPGIAGAVAAQSLAAVSDDARQLRLLEPGEAYMAGRSRWRVLQGGSVLPHAISAKVEADGISLQWQGESPLPAVLRWPLYDADGRPCWEAFALLSEMEASAEGSSGPLQVAWEPWHAGALDLQSFWCASRLGALPCGWSFLLPPGVTPRSLKVNLRARDGSRRDPRLWEQVAALPRRALCMLSSEGGEANFAPLLRAGDPNAEVRTLDMLGGAYWPSQAADLEAAGQWLAAWARWVLGGKDMDAWKALIPPLKAWRVVEAGFESLRVGRMEECHTSSGGMEAGRELALLYALSRQASWLCGSPCKVETEGE